MDEIAAGATAVSRPVRAETGARAKAERPKAARARRPKSLAPPAFRPPQLATLVDGVPAGDGWLHEMKYDGYRALLAVGSDEAKAYTRNGLDWSDRFAAIVAAAQATLPAGTLVDGEVVALDGLGHPSFGALQDALKGGDAPLRYFVFDLLEDAGEDVAALPLTTRKARLQRLIADALPPIHYADHVAGSGAAMLEGICREGLEGLIAKRADAPYRGGRSAAWLKVKCVHRQEFVILGWMPSDKDRGFRSLLLGVNDAGGLRYAGKVGTGFGQTAMIDLLARLQRIARNTAPVAAPRSAVRGAHWVRPTLVAEIAFAEFTGDGLVRHASFVGLRDDKPAAMVVEERPAPANAAAASPGPPGISHPDRVIFPESGITKGQLAAYYQTIAGPLLRDLAGRPVSLVRCPQGRAKHCFFQKHDAGSFGDHVHAVSIREKDGSDAAYLHMEDAAGVLACVQMGTIEFHGWGAKVDAVERPDRLVFDLDPDEGLGFAAVREAAVQLRDTLAEMGLASWPMLSGGKGVHVVVPLDATAEWPAVKDFASRFARAMGTAHPDRFTANMKKAERRGRIFLDWLRNQRGATAVLPYSARARANAPVAAPLTWEELHGTDTAARWTIADADELVARAASRALADWAATPQALPSL